MAQYDPARRPRLNRRHRANGTEIHSGTAMQFGFIVVVLSVGAALGADAWGDAQKRQAILEALPAGFTYSGCDEVRAAGVAPIRSTEPGFSDYLDGDGDGIGCESIRGHQPTG